MDLVFWIYLPDSVNTNLKTMEYDDQHNAYWRSLLVEAKETLYSTGNTAIRSKKNLRDDMQW